MSTAPRPQSAMAPDLHERLTQLEIKLSFTQDLVDELDRVVIRQQDQIDRLSRELQALRHPWHLQRAPAPTRVDERPPHY